MARWRGAGAPSAAVGARLLQRLLALQLLLAALAAAEYKEELLRHATEKDDSKFVTRLIASRVDVNAVNSEGMSALHLAALYGATEVTQVLVRAPDIEVLKRTPAGKTALEVADNSHNRDVSGLLRRHGGDPGLLVSLFYAVTSEPKKFGITLATSLVVAVLLSFAAAKISSLATFRQVKGPWQERPDEDEMRAKDPSYVPAGARIFAAEWLLAEGNCGTMKTLGHKARLLTEIFLNMILVVGPLLYHRDPLYAIPVVLIAQVLPATFHYGVTRLVSNPVLLASSDRSGTLTAVAYIRLVVILVVINAHGFWQELDVCFLPDYQNPVLEKQLGCEYYQGAAGLEWDTSATLDMPFGGIHETGIDMQEWFQTYEIIIICLSILGAVLTVVAVISRSRERRSDRAFRQEVEKLARRIAAMDSAAKMQEAKLEPVVWYPRLQYADLGLLAYVLYLYVDVFLDIKVMLDLLGRQHYNFFGSMLALTMSSAIGQIWEDGRRISLWAEYKESVRQGFMSEGLLSIFFTEAGWEAFGQLAITTYALPFLTQEPGPLITATLSILTSVWTLAGHLFYLVDLADVLRESGAEAAEQSARSLREESLPAADYEEVPKTLLVVASEDRNGRSCSEQCVLQ